MVDIDIIGVQGHKMHVFPGGDICPPLKSEGVYHPCMTKVVKDIVSEGTTCVDVGAHIGYFTLIMARLVGDSGRVIAFEPETNNFQLLIKNIEINGYNNITPVNKAVSNINGRAVLHVDGLGMGSHSLAVKHPNRPQNQVLEVEVQTLDSFFAGSDVINFVKIDVEGAEMTVLQGMEGIIERNNDLMIITEFLPHGLLAFGTQPRDFLKAVEGYGFSIYDIGEGGRAGCPVSPGHPANIDAIIKAHHYGAFTNLLLKRERKR